MPYSATVSASPDFYLFIYLFTYLLTYLLWRSMSLLFSFYLHFAIQLRYDSPDGVVSARDAAHISDIDGVKHMLLVAVSIQVKLYRGAVSERHKTNATDHRTVRRSLNIQHFHQLGHEPRYLLKVCCSHTSRRVQKKHHVGAVCASYSNEMCGELSFDAILEAILWNWTNVTLIQIETVIFFGNRVINAWNSLSDYIVTSPTVARFKGRIAELKFLL